MLNIGFPPVNWTRSMPLNINEAQKVEVLERLRREWEISNIDKMLLPG